MSENQKNDNVRIFPNSKVYKICPPGFLLSEPSSTSAQFVTVMISLIFSVDSRVETARRSG